jgi:group I intron endonuclease
MAYGLIYRVTNTINQKVYVGQTKQSLIKRWRAHVNASRKPRYTIQFAIAKYGADNFTIEQLCVAQSREELNDLEKQHIASFGSVVPNGYNLTYGGESPTFSEETIVRMSESHKGKKFGNYSEAWRKAISDALTGKSPSEETRRKQAAAKLGTKHSAETLLSMSIAQTGRKMSQEHRDNLSSAAKNRAPFTDEHKRRISESGQARTWVMSEEHRKAISKASTARHAAKRAQAAEQAAQ